MYSSNRIFRNKKILTKKRKAISRKDKYVRESTKI